MKASSAISGRATESPPNTGRSSGTGPRSRIADGGFPLAGPSNLPDPEFSAFRADLADAALAGRVIASHYAEPVERTIASRVALRRDPSEEAEALRELAPGEPFRMLDDALGWAWGYAGEDKRVGYVPSAALVPAAAG